MESAAQSAAALWTNDVEDKWCKADRTESPESVVPRRKFALFPSEINHPTIKTEPNRDNTESVLASAFIVST